MSVTAVSTVRLVGFLLVSLPMVERSVFGYWFDQLAIATTYIRALEKDKIGAPLRMILIHSDLQIIDTNTMYFTF